MTIAPHKESIKEQAELKRRKALQTAAQQMLSNHQPSRTGPFMSSPMPQLGGVEEDPLPMPETCAVPPRISEEAKLPGLSLLPVKQLLPSAPELKEPTCRNFKRIDSQTIIPGDTFEGMMRLRREAEKRGAHRFERKRGGGGVLRVSTARPRSQSKTFPPIEESRPLTSTRQWEIQQKHHLIGRLNKNVEKILPSQELMSSRPTITSI